MILTVSAPMAAFSRRMRLAMLVVIGVILAHEATYLAAYGVGADQTVAMTFRGHDPYWPTVVVVALLSAATLLLGATVTLVGLHARLAHARRRDGGRRSAWRSGVARRADRSEIVPLWRTLTPLVVGVFALQENLEYLLAHGDILGVEVLINPSAPFTLPIILLVTLALAVAGGIVRWRIATLRTRIALEAPRRRPSTPCPPPAREWVDRVAACPHSWIHSRADAGRAPPLAAAAS